MNNSKTIAVCCSTLRELSVLEPMDAICRTANENGYNVHIYQAFEELESDSEVSIGEKSVFELIDYDQICGMIIFGERIKSTETIREIIDKSKAKGIPVVSLDQKNEGCFNVTYDYADAFEQIVRHLVEYHKFKRFFVMAGIKDNPFSDERLDVVRKVFDDNGLTLKDDDIAYGGFWADPTKAAMEEFLDSKRELPEAFIAFNDTMAITVIDELQQHGYNVPDDVVVTGFDGIVLAENFIPRITTAKQQFDKGGSTAVELIINSIKGDETGSHDISIPFAVNIRQSCGCCGLDITGVTSNFCDLFAEFDECKRFGTYMDRMSRTMIAKDDIQGLISESSGYSVFLDCHDYINMCVRKSFLRKDIDFYEKACSDNISLANGTEEDSVLLFRTEQKNYIETEKNCFATKSLLPDLDEWNSKVKNSLIFSLHAGEDIYGHMVVDYKIGNRDTYKTKMYANKICSAMFLLTQKSLLKNTNRELLLTKDRLEEMYIKDPLTGIYNRRGFYQKYGDSIEEKSGGYVTVISVDLDKLKPINDNFGHKEGDFAIKALGEALAEVVGHQGIYARFGGDEFVAMLFSDEYEPDIDKRLYSEMVDILNKKKCSGNKEYDIQCSLGAVQKEFRKDIDIENMISQSDKLLYMMKRKHHEENRIRTQKYRLKRRV